MNQFHEFLENILENITYLIREWNWSSWNWWPSWQAEIKINIRPRYVNKIWIDFTSFLKILPYLKKVHKIWIWSHEFLESISYLISVKMGLIHWRFLRMLRKWLLQNLDRHSWLRFIAGLIWNEGEKIRFFFHFLKTLYYFEIDAFNLQVN